MALVRRLESDELALLEVWEDPIWFAEFLRSTADGSMQKDEWPKRPFEYRWYQRDLITDRSPYISLCAGRAVGKCNPPSARVFTPTGYKTIGELKKLPSFAVWALDERTQQFVQRRGKITRNGEDKIYRLTTKCGHMFDATSNHPVLTERGYVPLWELDLENDRVAVATRLPCLSQQSSFSWFELRWLGYIMGNRRGGPNNPMTLKYQRQVIEFEAIAKFFGAKLKVYPDGKTVEIERGRHNYKTYPTILSGEVGWSSADKVGRRIIPPIVKAEKLENLKVFLEAYASQHAEITTNRIFFNTLYQTLTYDLQELFLYFGIECEIGKVVNEFKETRWYAHISNYENYYKFFNTFQLPGISVKDLPAPQIVDERPSDWYRFDSLESLVLLHPGVKDTYAVTVWEDHNYICDHLIVHNSLVLEDKMIWESVNTDIAFPETREQTLFTANTAQMTPILDRLILRFMQGRVLKDWLQGNVNRSKGTFDFPQEGTNYRINARIAGQRGESNVVGLHVPKIKVDEVQLFPMTAYTQMLP